MDDTKESTQPDKIAETVKIPAKKKSNKTLYIVLGAVVFVFVVVPGILFTVGGIFVKSKLGSQEVTDKTVESVISKATGSKVDLNTKSGSVSIKGDNGETMSAGSSQKLPDDFPKGEIPFITQKEVTFVITSSDSTKKNWSVTTVVDKSFEDAKSYFEKAIAAPEFESTSSFGSNEGQTYSGTNTKYSVFVTVTKGKSNNDTNVTYIVTQK
jgi:hypothetical protein